MINFDYISKDLKDITKALSNSSMLELQGKNMCVFSLSNDTYLLLVSLPNITLSKDNLCRIYTIKDAEKFRDIFLHDQNIKSALLTTFKNCPAMVAEHYYMLGNNYANIPNLRVDGVYVDKNKTKTKEYILNKEVLIKQFSFSRLTQDNAAHAKIKMYDKNENLVYKAEGISFYKNPVSYSFSPNKKVKKILIEFYTSSSYANLRYSFNFITDEINPKW